jgi:chemotaxis protein MotB
MKKGAPAKAEKDRSERWLLTYSDLITLLLIFFIVLYSMSVVDAKKFEQVSQSLAIAFGSVGRSGVLDAGRSAIPGQQVYKERRSMQNTEEKIRRMIAQKGLEGKVSTDLTERGLVISVKDTVLFTEGSADLNGPAAEIVAGVARILSGTQNAIRVEGHTDTVPIHTGRFPSNWELSTARAISVLRYFIQQCDIAPERLSAAGYGEYKPAFPNSSDRNRALNRRVDIVLLSSAFSKFEPEGARPSAPASAAEEIAAPPKAAPDSVPAPSGEPSGAF